MSIKKIFNLVSKHNLRILGVIIFLLMMGYLCLQTGNIHTSYIHVINKIGNQNILNGIIFGFLIMVLYIYFVIKLFKNLFSAVVRMYGEMPEVVLSKIRIPFLIKSGVYWLIVIILPKFSQYILRLLAETLAKYNVHALHFINSIGFKESLNIINISAGKIEHLIIILLGIVIGSIGVSSYLIGLKHNAFVKTMFIHPVNNIITVVPSYGVIFYVYVLLQVLMSK